MGPRDYKVLKNYAKKMDILCIPLMINNITKATSPVKVFEYMALQKPIVTTDMDECRKYKSVLIGKNTKQFLKQLEAAYKKRNDKDYIKALKIYNDIVPAETKTSTNEITTYVDKKRDDKREMFFFGLYFNDDVIGYVESAYLSTTKTLVIDYFILKISISTNKKLKIWLFLIL